MSSQLIDGKALAAKIQAAAKEEAADLDRTPGFAAVLVGDNPASQLYVRLKEKACAEAGINFEKLLVRADVGQEYLERVIRTLNARPDIDAILLQLPLPSGLDADRAIAAIDPAKDVDGFHAENVRRLKEGRPRLVPGLPAGIAELIKSTGEELRGKTALVIANSPIFFEPLGAVLTEAGLVPSFVTAEAADLAAQARGADVLIVAVGRPRFLTGDLVKPGAVVIDVGTNRVDGKTVGDVDFDSVKETAAHLTPVPGGVGPMTVAMVVANCVKLAKQRQGK